MCTCKNTEHHTISPLLKLVHCEYLHLLLTIPFQVLQVPIHEHVLLMWFFHAVDGVETVLADNGSP
jgi:hypothetical protein